MTQADLARSVDYFRQAIALDPDFALGWTGLSQAYSIQAGYGWAPVTDGFERRAMPPSGRWRSRRIWRKDTSVSGTCSRATTGTGKPPMPNISVRSRSHPATPTCCVPSQA